MTTEELRALVAEVRRTRRETQSIEVKTARGGTPGRALRESLSAFVNRHDGGVILFGLDEQRRFEVVGVHDAQRLQEDVANAAAEMEPPLRPEITVAEIDGKPVVAVEVPEVGAVEKPCHIRAAGIGQGSFIRVGPTNRRMSDYEIYGYQSIRTQPSFDAEPVAEADAGDLDQAKIDDYLSRLRTERPDAPYHRLARPDTLTQLGITRTVDGVPRPTLAGLLMFGAYPQALEPQFVITFLRFAGTDEFEPGPRGERFLDNRKFEGTLDVMIDRAVAHVVSSIRSSSLIEGLFRKEIPEYPVVAIREAVINAVAHRDYSPYVRGSYIQIRLFADRLEIQSPGGLFGNVTEETIEDEQTTRNRRIVRLLEDFHLVENRGSGIKAMIRAMREANLEPPRFEDRRLSFWVTFRNHTLMSPDAIGWLNQFAQRPMNDQQRLSLVFLLHNERMTNSDYRRLAHVDMGTATRDLRGLAAGGLVAIHGTGRWTSYTLQQHLRPAVETLTEEERLLAFVAQHGSISNAQTQELLGISARRAKSVLTRLRKQRRLRMEGNGRSIAYVLENMA